MLTKENVTQLENDIRSNYPRESLKDDILRVLNWARNRIVSKFSLDEVHDRATLSSEHFVITVGNDGIVIDSHLPVTFKGRSLKKLNNVRTSSISDVLRGLGQ